MKRFSVMFAFLTFAFGLAGCDNTSVAFCSGGEDFCENFILRVGGPQDDEEEGGDEPASEEGAEPTSAGVQAALKVARLTPAAIQSALAYDTMGTLATQEPELLGLWLIQASLARLRESGDNLATTRFLDQNRAWMSPRSDADAMPMVADAPLLGVGLKLFADFAADIDPASAEFGRILAGAFTMDCDEPGALLLLSTEGAQQIVLDAIEVPEDCCTDEVLAASAVILCEVAQVEGNLPEAGASACYYAGHWFVKRVRKKGS